jgi:pyruvate/2-oxoglutarate/acetoin dehydrogenase E1 component
LLGEDIGV